MIAAVNYKVIIAFLIWMQTPFQYRYHCAFMMDWKTGYKARLNLYQSHTWRCKGRPQSSQCVV